MLFRSIVGAPGGAGPAGVQAGRGYVVFGKTSSEAVDLTSIAAGGGAGFVIQGQGPFDASGSSVSSAGDMNGDGLADLLIGAPRSDPAAGVDAGRSDVVFGKTSTTPVDLSRIAEGIDGIVINGASAGDEIGRAHV